MDMMFPKGVVEEENCKFVGKRHKSFKEPEGRRMYIKSYKQFQRPDNGFGPEIKTVKKYIEIGVMTATMVINKRIRKYKDKDVIVSKIGEGYMTRMRKVYMFFMPLSYLDIANIEILDKSITTC